MGSTENGLNLTRATLNAMLKYPWLHGAHPIKKDKWGAYDSDSKLFDWARELGPGPLKKAPEAELMDWADDVTYSVHDLDDFFRAGVIPLDRLVIDTEERQRLYKEVFERRKGQLPADMDDIYLRGAFDQLLEHVPVKEPYSPTQRQRMRLRFLTSTWIRDFVTCVAVDCTSSSVSISIPKIRRAEIFMLKQLAWHYVIKNPALATQQHGQRTIIRKLFGEFFEAGTKRGANTDIFPISVRELLPPLPASSADQPQLARLIIDFIASLTEKQAVSTYHRMTGIALGSSLTYKVR
jgi:dGTPase